MEWLQQLISDPSQRDAIGWVAGGITALASGIWVVFRFFIEKKTNRFLSNKSVPASRIEQKISASGHAVAAGRDANVGIRGAYVVVLVLLILAILMFGLSAFGENFVRNAVGEHAPIPAFALSLTCGSSEARNPYQIDESERKNIVDFVDFMREYEDKVVYLDVRIARECAACKCARALKERSDAAISFEDPYLGVIHIDNRTVEERKQYFSGWGTQMNIEGIELTMFAPKDWAVGNVVFLPRPVHLTESQYRSGEYGTYASFNGLFTARFRGATGGNAIEVNVLRPSDQQEKQLRCIREYERLLMRQRLYLGC